MMPATGDADKTVLFTLLVTDWRTHREALAAVRRRVFVEEQRVPEALEWDDEDEEAIHLLAFDLGGEPIACARLLHDGRLGRMAVLPAYRGCGIGSALLAQAIELFREQCFEAVAISAQVHAIGFYEQAGFKVCSDEYDDAGIPHRDMKLALSP